MTNLKFTAKTESEAQSIIANLKNNGFCRINNCYWFEDWKNADGETATIERDF